MAQHLPSAQARTAPTTGPGDASCWPARLSLEFERRGTRTVLAHARHLGPLGVQKMLYPEGEQVCHAIVLHPPGGVAAGDQLAVNVSLAAGSAVFVTTPGAAKWYRSGGSSATSATRLVVAEGATLEYLPREAIVFNGAMVCSELDVDLAVGARAVGCDLWCLGRTSSGERFTRGQFELTTRLRLGGRLRWEERGSFDADASLLRAAAGLADETVFGTLWAAGCDAPRELVDECRRIPVGGAGRGALTQLPDVLLARYLGRSTEQAFAWFTGLWSTLRPAYAGRVAVQPRIWTV
jgi:urease accessory protein